MEYRTINTGGRVFNLALGVTSAAVFATSVTNCIVYARNTSSSQNMNSGSGSNNEGGNGISANCSTLMLALNVILCIISFIAMLYFFYKTIFTFEASHELVSKLKRKFHNRKHHNSPTVSDVELSGSE